jgi:uncharacterized protein YoxC
MPAMIPSTLLQVAGAADTTYTRIIGTELSGLAQALAIAEIGAVILVYVFLGVAVFALLRLQKGVSEAREKLDGVQRDVRELVESGNQIVAKATGIVESVRASVDSVHETVEYANRRAQRAVSDLADRVDEFNRTLALIQSDTQNVVVAALSAVRGVRAGVHAFKTGRRARHVEGNGETPEALPSRPRLKRRAPAGA